jgi:bacterial/archaeal transporter family protein
VPIWVAYALGVLTFWGIAGVTQKRSTDFVSAELSFTCFSLAFIPLAASIIWIGHVNWHIPAKGWALGIVSGALSGLGALASFGAYHSGGKASVVTPMAALYPMVTVALAVPLLHEHLGLRQLVGVAIALSAAVALSYEEGQDLTREP